MKAMRKHQKQQQQQERKKKTKKAVMYEADDLGDSATNDAAVHAGLGERGASQRVRDKISKMHMPLEKRFQIEEETDTYAKIVNKGNSKEITYVPKDARKKREEKQQTEREDDEPYSRSKRQRRSIKGLGGKYR